MNKFLFHGVIETIIRRNYHIPKENISHFHHLKQEKDIYFFLFTSKIVLKKNSRYKNAVSGTTQKSCSQHPFCFFYSSRKTMRYWSDDNNLLLIKMLGLVSTLTKKNWSVTCGSLPLENVKDLCAILNFIFTCLDHNHRYTTQCHWNSQKGSHIQLWSK